MKSGFSKKFVNIFYSFESLVLVSFPFEGKSIIQQSLTVSLLFILVYQSLYQFKYKLGLKFISGSSQFVHFSKRSKLQRLWVALLHQLPVRLSSLVMLSTVLETNQVIFMQQEFFACRFAIRLSFPADIYGSLLSFIIGFICHPVHDSRFHQ